MAGWLPARLMSGNDGPRRAWGAGAEEDGYPAAVPRDSRLFAPMRQPAAFAGSSSAVRGSKGEREVYCHTPNTEASLEPGADKSVFMLL